MPFLEYLKSKTCPKWLNVVYGFACLDLAYLGYKDYPGGFLCPFWILMAGVNVYYLLNKRKERK